MKPTNEEPEDNNLKYWVLLGAVILLIFLIVSMHTLASESIEKDYLSKLTPEERQNIIDREQAQLEENRIRAEETTNILFEPVEMPFIFMIGIFMIGVWYFMRSITRW